jgi:predicted RNA-binding Zn-ribbon protein involved in translation (DUF1610 family)
MTTGGKKQLSGAMTDNLRTINEQDKAPCPACGKLGLRPFSWDHLPKFLTIMEHLCSECGVKVMYRRPANSESLKRS